jgi:Txe/YoeB family toxin of Txe-Axe toxin-antitoxin module
VAKRLPSPIALNPTAWGFIYQPFGLIQRNTYLSQDLNDLQIPPSNRLEKLKGDLKDFYSIRINNQWRIIFKWNNGNAEQVQIIDYH